MTNATFDFSEMERGLEAYLEAVQEAVVLVLEAYQPILESSAKELAPWEDQTGNARQLLYAEVVALSEDTVALYLAHGVEYGIHLETRWAGKFGIIWNSIQDTIPSVLKTLQEVFS